MSDLKLYGSIEEFRQAAKAAQEADKPLGDSKVRVSFDTEVKADEGEDGEKDSRKLKFTISTDSVDRYGDTVAVDGWDLKAYKKNPVVLWAHNSSILPVGKAPKTSIEDGKLKSTAEFTPAGMHPFNDTVYDMYKQGFLNATSVGFIPTKWVFSEDKDRRYGMDFMEQELLEFSCVPVPANSEALIEGRSAGIDVGPMLDWMYDSIVNSAGVEKLIELANGKLKDKELEASLLDFAQERLAGAGDTGRILKLAETVLGSSADDVVALAWAKKIAATAKHVIVPQERIERIERAARQQRLDKKRQQRERELDVIRAKSAT